MHRPTRFEIMRARREEFERWERVRRQRTQLESLFVGSSLRQACLSLPEREELLAKIDQCEREVVRSWRERPEISDTTLPPEPQHQPGLISRLFFWWRY